MISRNQKPACAIRYLVFDEVPNGLRYPRWDGRRNAVRLGKW